MLLTEAEIEWLLASGIAGREGERRLPNRRPHGIAMLTILTEAEIERLLDLLESEPDFDTENIRVKLMALLALMRACNLPYP
jgi:hypothetical protein